MCNARAPPIVDKAKVSRAGKSVGSLRLTLASRAAKRSSSNMSKSLLLAVLSVPMPTLRPISCISATAAMPLPSFKLLVGQCATPAPASCNSFISGRVM